MTSVSLADELQKTVGDVFINVVAEKLPEVAAILRDKHKAVNNVVKAMSIHKQRMLASTPEELDAAAERSVGEPEEVARFLGEAGRRDDLAVLLKVAEMDAKLVDVMWRVRKTIGIMTVNAANAYTPNIRTGDKFNEIIERFTRKNLSAADVQELVRYAFVWPSLTTHPTNPTSFQYTKVGAALDRLLARAGTSREQLSAALRDIRDVPMHYDLDENGQCIPRKTPLLEIEELLLPLGVIYDSVVGPTRRLEAALKRFGYDGVKVDGPLVDVNVWGAGDGDGNPNMTAALLQAQVDALRAAIRRRYVAELRHPCFADAAAAGFERVAHETVRLAARLEQQTITAAQLEEAIALLVSDLTYNFTTKAIEGAWSAGASFDAHGDEQKPTKAPKTGFSPEVARRRVADLLIKVRSFGLHFARTDVRHNSVDIMDTAAALLRLIGAVPDAAAFVGTTPPDEQSDVIRAALDDAVARQRISAMTDEELAKQLQSDVAGRVLLRMRVMARHPDMFQKLIIAETRTSANALAALLLLRYAGNIVAADGARINVVPLFESRQDLLAAPRTFHQLASDRTFAEHLRHCGMFIAMIAKSDTTRLSGPGVQGRQEETVARLMAACAKSYSGGHFKMMIFVGGGDDQMRGGGRIVETPHVLTLAANRQGATQPTRFAMTVQGLQLQLVFGAPLLAETFIEGFAAQQMLAAARLSEKIKFRPVPPTCNRKAADTAAHDFFRDAMNNYERLAGVPAPAGGNSGGASDADRSAFANRQTVVDYFAGFPNDIVASGNKSSRPMARKKTVDPLQGRAISLDQLSKHDGGYMTATLGVAAALRAMNDDIRLGAPETPGHPFMTPVRHTYLANKSFRDFVRMQAVVLFQKEYRTAWLYRGGAPKDDAERQSLLAEYESARAAAKPARPRAFLAYLEREDHEEARLLLQAVSGRILPPDATVDLAEPLRVGWPDLAARMTFRRRQSALAQHLQSRVVLALNKPQHAGADCKRKEQLGLLGYFAYVGVNPKFSTPSFSLTMTDPQKEGARQGLETARNVQSHIPVPLWAREANALLVVAPGKL